MTLPVQWQLYLGPAWHRSDSPYYFDWNVLVKDNAATLDYFSTLSSPLASGASTLTLANASSFATKGGVWVGPVGSGEAWEYIDYSGKTSNTLSGLVREPLADREHNGNHATGAPVRTWWKVAGDDGSLRISMQLEQNFCANDWRFEVSGIAAPQAALQPLHLAVVLYRNGVSGALLDMFTGFLGNATIRDDSKRVRQWSASMGSIAMLLQSIEVQGIRVGAYDAAQHGDARSSIPLGAAHKERTTADFVAANPSFDPSNVLDKDSDGLWIGDRLIGTNEPPGTFSGISQIYINPPLSINGGSKWLEIINRDTASVELIAWDSIIGAQFTLDIPSEEVGEGQRFIIAENASVFQKENPTSQGDFIFDVSGSDNPSWFNRLTAAGGAVALNFMGSISSAVFWGTTTPAIAGFGASTWTGPSMVAPAFDQTMRIKMNDRSNSNTRDNWEVSFRQSPGYPIENNNRGEQAWISVDLPSMGLILHDDITSTVPGVGALLSIDGQNGPSTDGLPATGTLVIGDERISYSAKSKSGVTVSGRGVSGTTASSHLAGDAVFIVFVQGGRTTITDAIPALAIKWERSGGTMYPSDFKWRYSAISARTPDQEQHEDDYEVLNPVTGNVAASYTQGLSNNRIKTVLLEFNKMTHPTARPRLNRLIVLVDPTFYDGNQWLSSGQTVEQLVRQVALNAGIANGLITVIAGGAAPTGFTTALDKSWSVMVSAAELGGSVIGITRDSRIRVAPDAFWETATSGYTPVKTWIRANASSVQFVRTGGPGVSQIKLNWETPDGITSDVSKYPATPDVLGSVQEIGPLFFANQAQADLAARKRFFLARYPYQLEVTLAAGDLSVEPGQIHRVQWDFAADMQLLDRMILVSQVQHVLTKGLLGTVLQGVLIDQEWQV